MCLFCILKVMNGVEWPFLESADAKLVCSDKFQVKYDGMVEFSNRPSLSLG